MALLFKGFFRVGLNHVKLAAADFLARCGLLIWVDLGEQGLIVAR